LNIGTTYVYSYFVMKWYLYVEQFPSTPLSPTTKDAYDLSKATTQLLVVDVACD